MDDPRSYHFDLPITGRPNPHAPNIQHYPGICDHWESSTISRSVDALLGITTIVLHSTNGMGSEDAMRVLKSHELSWHWLIPDNEEPQHGSFVWACMPEARAVKNVRSTVAKPDISNGRVELHDVSLSIALVNRHSPSRPNQYSSWQVGETARLVRYCWAKYPNLKHIVSHAMIDPEKQTDPGGHFPWNRFRKFVLETPAPQAAPLVSRALPMDLLVALPVSRQPKWATAGE